MTIYLDEDYKCRLSPPGTPVQTAFFDGKCDAFIEGYRYVPRGDLWTCPDGVTFRGEMVAPWQDPAVLQAAQDQYEALLPRLQDMEQALMELGVTV